MRIRLRDEVRVRHVRQLRTLGIVLAVGVALAFGTRPLSAALDRHMLRQIESASRITPVARPVLASCLSYDSVVYSPEGLDGQAVVAAVKNTCATDGVVIDARVDLLVHVDGTQQYVSIDSDELTRYQSHVVLTGAMPDPGIPMEACARIHGTWQPTNRSQAPLPIEDMRCP